MQSSFIHSLDIVEMSDDVKNHEMDTVINLITLKWLYCPKTVVVKECAGHWATIYQSCSINPPLWDGQ